MFDETRLPDVGLEPKRTNGISRRSLLGAAGATGLLAMGSFLPARAQDRPQLRIAISNSVMTVNYPYIANAQAFGLFEREGVDVEVVMGQGTPQVLSLLVAGTVDLVFCNPEPMARLITEQGMDLKSIFVGQQSQYILAVPDGSPIQSISDLRGKRIGMFSPESGIDYLRARLIDEDMTTDDVQIIPTGFGGQVVGAVQQNQVDAVMYWTDAMVLMKQAGLNLRRLPKAEWEAGFYQFVGVTKQETIDSRSDALTRAVKAMAPAIMLSFLAPKATVEAFWEQYPDQAPQPEAREAALESNIERVLAINAEQGLPLDAGKEQIMAHQWGSQSLPVWTRKQEMMKRVNLITNEVDPQRFFDNRFIEAGNDFDREEIYRMAEARE